MSKKTFTYMVKIDVDLDGWAAEYAGCMGEDTPEIDALNHLSTLLVASVEHLFAQRAVDSITATPQNGAS